MPAPAETINKINSFAELPTGWHYGEGVPPSHEAIKKARLLHTELIRTGFIRTNAFPGIDGQIMVTAYRGSEYHEFSLELNGTFNYVLEVGNREQDCKEGLSLEEALEIVRELANTLWATFESSITHTLMPRRATSKVTHSGTLPMVAASQWLMKSVPSGRVLVSVPTLAASTLYRPMIQPFFGGFVPERFPVDAISFKEVAQLGTSAISTFKDFLTKKQNESSNLLSEMISEFA